MNDPLVSIVVITYNSAKYILEALNSCKNQTYDNIELIISDDASKDNTVVICEKWLKRNGDRFTKTKFITSENNTGIAPNLNRGVKESSGDWVKPLAGDDSLLPSIITDYIQYVNQNPSIKIIHSNPILYKENFDENSLIEKKDCSDLRINSPNISAGEQFQILLRNGPIYASSAMIHRTIYEKIGYYDERAPFWEDKPFWLNATSNGFKIHFLNVYGIRYRKSITSVQAIKSGTMTRYTVSSVSYRYKYLIKYYSPLERLTIRQAYYTMKLILLLGNKNNKLCKSIWVFSKRIRMKLMDLSKSVPGTL